MTTPAKPRKKRLIAVILVLAVLLIAALAVLPLIPKDARAADRHRAMEYFKTLTEEPLLMDSNGLYTPYRQRSSQPEPGYKQDDPSTWTYYTFPAYIVDRYETNTREGVRLELDKTTVAEGEKVLLYRIIFDDETIQAYGQKVFLEKKIGEEWYKVNFFCSYPTPLYSPHNSKEKFELTWPENMQITTGSVSYPGGYAPDPGQYRLAAEISVEDWENELSSDPLEVFSVSAEFTVTPAE